MGTATKTKQSAKKLASARAERCEGAWQKHVRGPGRYSILAALEVNEAGPWRGQTLEVLFIIRSLPFRPRAAPEGV